MQIGKYGVKSSRPAHHTPRTGCVFEYIYFARPDSMVFGRNVYEAREAIGRELAREHPIKADIVVPIPDSGFPAAIGFAEVSGIPLRMGFIRDHYTGRTFIEPQQSIRHFGVRLKLSPVPQVVSGKRIVLIDDSIVRGNISRKTVQMLRDAGAAEIHMRISSPPMTHSCFYGIDTPTRKELIASDHTVEEIRQWIGVDTLGYLSETGLRRATSSQQGGICTACFTGNYPVPVPNEALRS
jgi:amidophosphoribosyltransferase